MLTVTPPPIADDSPASVERRQAENRAAATAFAHSPWLFAAAIAFMASALVADVGIVVHFVDPIPELPLLVVVVLPILLAIAFLVDYFIAGALVLLRRHPEPRAFRRFRPLIRCAYAVFLAVGLFLEFQGITLLFARLFYGILWCGGIAVLLVGAGRITARMVDFAGDLAFATGPLGWERVPKTHGLAGSLFVIAGVDFVVASALLILPTMPSIVLLAVVGYAQTIGFVAAGMAFRNYRRRPLAI